MKAQRLGSQAHPTLIETAIRSRACHFGPDLHILIINDPNGTMVSRLAGRHISDG